LEGSVCEALAGLVMIDLLLVYALNVGRRGWITIVNSILCRGVSLQLMLVYLRGKLVFIIVH